ncbi:MAG: hypothetical protein HY873_02630, partial [Chloroflexi bacterium]|nr:hypothetical protein [Chloroflexota bacterium]
MITLLAIPAVALFTVGFAIGYTWAHRDDEAAERNETQGYDLLPTPEPIIPIVSSDLELFEEFERQTTESRRALVAMERDLVDWATEDLAQGDAFKELEGICEGAPLPSETFYVDAKLDLTAEICLSAQLKTNRSLDDIAATVRTILRP